MQLEYEFSLQANLKEPLAVGPGPFGTRLVFVVTDGSVTGERLNAKILPGGGDWLLVGGDGWGHLDVRVQLVTDDGAAIYVSYGGVLEVNEKVQRATEKGTGTAFEDQYFRTTPRLETGDARYAWVNHAVFVAEGRLIPPRGVAYKVYRVM